MISTIKKDIEISENLYSKIKWACNFKNCVPKITCGCFRVIKHTNLAYVEPHRVIIKGNLFLFFNDHDYFYINNLTNKFPISKLQDMIN